MTTIMIYLAAVIVAESVRVERPDYVYRPQTWPRWKPKIEVENEPKYDRSPEAQVKHGAKKK